MKIESDTTRVRPSMAPVPPSTARADHATTDWILSPTACEVLKCLPDLANRVIARAPGRLEVMGGSAEYTGSLVLNLPLEQGVCVGAQPCEQHQLAITTLRTGGSGAPMCEPTVVPLDQLLDGQGSVVGAEQARSFVNSDRDVAARCVLGTVVEILREKRIPRLDRGLTLVVGSALGDRTDVGFEAALSAGTMVALSALFGVTLVPEEAAVLCQRVTSQWLDLPIGVGDPLCALLGEAGSLQEVHCASGTVAGRIRLPAGLAMVGIDSGVTRPDAMFKYTTARTAAFMGIGLIDCIIRHDGVHDTNWHGRLSEVSMSEFVERFRDRLPTKLAGSEYLQRFGETSDPVTKIDPTFAYKIRSRVEHHVYEHARTCQFAECLSRASREPGELDDAALAEAGELMSGSHWSYGQRCGLGNIETDLLVNLVREHGSEAGVFGAKATGRGCGGVVAVLMRATESARSAVDAAIQAYRSKTGKPGTLLKGSSPGAMLSGARRVASNS